MPRRHAALCCVDGDHGRRAVQDATAEQRSRVFEEELGQVQREAEAQRRAEREAAEEGFRALLRDLGVGSATK